MLQKLSIKNVALIESVVIPFTSGLNVLSGETGAGKSVIIESLNFVLGAKADKSLIRTGETECVVRAEFDVSENQAVTQIFNDFDIEIADELIVTRKFTIDGKSSIKVNGETVTASMLKKFTSALLDVHGQSEHFYLLKSANQLNLLDKFAGEKLAEKKTELEKEYSEYKQILKSIDELGGDEESRNLRLGVLEYQINEIENADLKDGEEEQLVAIRDAIRNKEKILSVLSLVKSAVDGDGGAGDILSSVERSVIGISSYGAEYSSLADKISALISEMDDITSDVDTQIESLSDNDYDADSVEARLDLIKKLKRKYGSNYAEIMAFLSDAQAEKDKLEHFNETAEKLLADKLKKESIIYSLYLDIHKLRISASEIFTNNVLKELSELSIGKANFKVHFEDVPEKADCKFNSANGFDVVEFLFSANLGEPLKTLSSVISGGEMSRFMLAIKAQTAKYNDISTFIFDEIDAGISGNVAKVVAEKFARISKDVQVIAITHLPQITAMSDNALFIEKVEDSGKMVTTVKSLGEAEKVNEIIRLVGGNVDSLSAREHATELIKIAKTYKESI